MLLSRPRAHQRILQQTAGIVSWQPLGPSGETSTTAGTVTVTITNAAGTALVTAGATSGSSTSPRTYTLGVTTVTGPDYLTAVWTDNSVARATTYVEVVGGYYATLADVRAADPALADLTRHTDTSVIARRWDVEDEFENVAGVCFVPRFRTARLRSTGRRDLVLPDPMLRSVRFAKLYDGDTLYYTLTASDLADIPAATDGVARWDDGWTAGYDVVIGYETGFDAPPQDVLEAFYLRLRNRLNSTRTGVPERAVTWAAAEGGTYSLATPGRGGSITGIPEVDVVLQRYRDHFHAPGIA